MGLQPLSEANFDCSAALCSRDTSQMRSYDSWEDHYRAARCLWLRGTIITAVQTQTVMSIHFLTIADHFLFCLSDQGNRQALEEITKPQITNLIITKLLWW